MTDKRSRNDASLKILANTRLWSDRLELADLGRELGPRSQLLRKGERLYVPASGKWRIVPRHYYSTQDVKLNDLSAVSGWVEAALLRLNLVPGLPALIRSLDIEAVFWVYVSGGIRRRSPTVAPAVVQRVAALGARIYIEHWFDEPEPDGRWPEEIWLPASGSADRSA